MNARGEVPPIAEIFADHQIYSACEVGNVREENQDFVGFFHTPKSTLLIVADGMGGHSGGFEASRMAVKEMGVFFNENQDLAPEVLLGQSIVHAHTSILEFAQSNPKFEGMGTTIVALILCDNQVWVAHVGDSRIHLLRDGQFIQLTIDHSCVNTLARMGEIDIPDLDNHPFGHLLERSLGVESNLEVEVRPEPIAVKTGDKFILSSDGFWQSCQDKDAIRILSNNDHSAAVQEALEHALELTWSIS